MKNTLIHTTILAVLAISSNAFAQASLNTPLPNTTGNAILPAPAPASSVSVKTPPPKGPAGNVDKVLERIQKNMLPQADMIDQQAEASINRDLNLSRSTGQLLRPVGYMQVGDERVVFASEDGVRVIKLKENSRIGVMKIAKISEDGVEYKVSGKEMYAPLAYMAAEPPKTPLPNTSSTPSSTPSSPVASPSGMPAR